MYNSSHKIFPGNQLLTLGMVTPTGNPIEELTYKKTRNTIYTVSGFKIE